MNAMMKAFYSPDLFRPAILTPCGKMGKDALKRDNNRGSIVNPTVRKIACAHYCSKIKANCFIEPKEASVWLH